jgi:ADP-L-glycero-D-manno-heptose 6-epimerase
VHRFDAQLAHHGVARLFGAAEGCAAGEQRRDFVHVDDLCAVLEWSLEEPDVTGLLNVGSGESTSFNAVATALIAARGGGRIEYIDFPDTLRGRYQAATCADLRQLRAAGFRGIPRRVTEAIAAGWRETPAGTAA